MGNVLLRYKTMQRTQLIDAVAAIHKYDIAATNNGLGLTQNSPLEICCG